jgi:transcriptional regulator with XRE-family HTH domain
MLSEENVPNERLRRARHLKRWTQSDLAEAVGTDFETVSRWERGITMPSAYFREHLCRVLEHTPEELGFVQSRDEPLAPSTAPCVFLAASYADAEREFTSQLKAHLQVQGVTVLSSRSLRRQGGQNQRKALQEAIRAAQVVLFIASPEAHSSRHVQHAVQIARIYQMPVYALWIDGERWQECVPPKDNGEFFATLDVRERHDLTRVEEIVAMLEAVFHASNKAAQESVSESEPAGLLPEPRNPYKGLQAFSGDDRGDFFGRDRFIAELAQTLNKSLAAEGTSPSSARMLAIVGPSGSGKSSVVLAGLLPRLQAGALAGSQNWVYLDPIIPGNHSIEAFAFAFAKCLPDRSLMTIREDLSDDSTSGVHLLACMLGKQRETRVVLFVDQFEEVFTQTTSEEERQHFLDLLVTAMSEPQGPAIVILTLRADFYDRPMQYPDLFHLIEAHHSFVLPMDLKELRDVIEKPAELPDVQLTFEGNLVSDLLFEVQEQVGALPLLQFTLDQLFQRRDSHRLTLRAFEEIGGVKGAVAKHAETTYNSLPSEEHRRLARGLFLRLIDPGVTTQDTTRRRIPRSELVLSNSKETAILEQVTRAFISARLLTSNSKSGKATVEVSHEAVIREWTRLAEWLDAAREDVHRQQTISEDASEWEQLGKPRDRLYRGTQLKEAQTWASRNTPSWDEAAFLRASASRQKRTRISLVAIYMLIILLVIPAGLLLWQTFFPPNATTVTKLADSGPNSLRQAIDSARVGGVVTFEPGLKGVIRLTSNIDIGKDLSIRGPGERNLFIVGDGSYNVIQIEPWATVSISDLAFKGTHQSAFGTIINNGTLTITNVSVSGNTTTAGGGGISNLGRGNFLTGGGGTLKIYNSIISNNQSEIGWGGGIGNYGGSVNIFNSIISNNSAFAGAGIYNDDGPLTIINSTISDNTSRFGGYGGGILNVNGGRLSLTNSLVFNNEASSGWGGGISNGYSYGNTNSGNMFNLGGPVTLTNTTISNNRAAHGGGMILNRDSQASITFCTIYGNTATEDGGGVAIVTYNPGKPSQVVMRNTLIAMNNAPSIPDISGTLTSDGYNLIQNDSGAIFISNKQHFTDVPVQPRTNLRIDPALSGKMPQIHALLSDSPAIDRIPLDACHINGISNDQLGDQRPDGNENTCDIGAFESSS